MSSSNLLTGFCILLGIQFVCTWAVALLGLHIPAALLGMLLLINLLLSGIINISRVEDICRLLLEKMGLLFVPAGVGIVLYKEQILIYGWQLFVLIAFTTMLVIIGSGLFVEKFLNHNK